MVYIPIRLWLSFMVVFYGLDLGGAAIRRGDVFCGVWVWWRLWCCVWCLLLAAD